MIELAQALANCDEKFFCGWILGRAEIKITAKAKKFTNEVLLCKNHKAVLKVTGFDDNNLEQESLKVFLILPEEKLKKASKLENFTDEREVGELFLEHSFNFDDIKNYVDLSGDKNIIHRNKINGQVPVVPGLCMVWYLQKFLKMDKLNWKVSWLSPVYANDCVYFYRKDDVIRAYVDNINVFVVKLNNKQDK